MRETLRARKATIRRSGAMIADLTDQTTRSRWIGRLFALKRKAAQLGAIKEMTEDPQTGSLTIKVEV